MLILGIDDAGRGPLIGPMILGGVLIEKDKEKELSKIGAKDSKLLSHSERIRISKQIEKIVKNYVSISVEPNEIDEAVISGFNLNTLEAKKMAFVINKLNTKKDKIKVVVDCPSTNIQAWRAKLISFIEHKDNLDVVCEHKADANYPSVSAASILAKVAREEAVEKIKKEYGEIGSGYPSDPYTQKFLNERGKELENSGIFRKSWATWKSLFNPDKSKQKKLGDF